MTAQRKAEQRAREPRKPRRMAYDPLLAWVMTALRKGWTPERIEGRLACERGVPVRFFTATGLLMRLRRAQQENRLDRELASIGKARLLIIDEFGYLPIDEEGSRLLFQIISDSYETRSIIYTTNIEFSGWGRVLGDKNMAAALIDRTVHHGRLIRFEGRSYRSEHALMTK